MSGLNLPAILAEHGFFHGLPARLLIDLATQAKVVDYGPDQWLGREGAASDLFYLIRSGRIALEVHTPNRGSIRIQTVGPGEPVGWSWLVPPHRWQFDARTIESTEAIAIDGRHLRDMCERDHELGYQLLKRLVTVIAGRLTATRLQLLDIYQ